MTPFNRTDLGSGLAAAGLARFLLASSCAAAEPLALAVTDFAAATPDAVPVAREMTAAVKGRLLRDQGLSLVEASAERNVNVDAIPRFADWRALHAKALVVGRVSTLADGRIKTEFCLWDVDAGSVLLGRQTFVSTGRWPAVAQNTAEIVSERLRSRTSR